MKRAKLNDFLKNDNLIKIWARYFDHQIDRVGNTDHPLRKIISNLIYYSFL